MFKKPFKVKSNVQLRNSDKRKFLGRLPANVGKQLQSLQAFSGRPFCSIKLENFQFITLNAYGCENTLLFFELSENGALYPTGGLFNVLPGCYPIVLVNDFVYKKLAEGADLMLPGVYVSETFSLPKFPSNSPVLVAMLNDNTITGPLAVATSLMSSDEMISNGMKGRGFRILHIYNDELWVHYKMGKMATNSISKFCEHYLAVNGEEENLSESLNEILLEENLEDQGNSVTKFAELGSEKQQTDLVVDGDPPINDVDKIAEMERMLLQVFLAAVRHKMEKECQLPIDAGQFYANFILKNLPDGRRIDMKKTKYKKFSTFLSKVNDECGQGDWIVKVASKKGIDTIEQLNINHSAVRSAEFPPSDESGESATTSDGAGECRIKVAECFSATESVMLLLRGAGVRRGDVLQQNQVRDILAAYAKEKKLERPGNKIELDDTLQTLVKYFLPEAFPLNDVVQKVCGQMTRAFQITTSDGRKRVHRGRLPLIEFKVERRSGNKTVTLINNATVYGIDEKALCHRIQVANATGTSITASASNCEGPQILVHGNKIKFIGDELMNVYGIQKKFIKGLELAIEEKKKKKK